MSQNRGSFADSALSALSPGNILLKLVMFVVFGLLTAFPYLIKNLDEVYGRVTSEGYTGLGLILPWLKAIMGATWKGVFIGLSTLFHTMLNLGDVIDEVRVGTILYSILVIIFATLTLYQPVRFLFDVLDREKGQAHSMALVGAVSVLLILVIAAPLSYLLTGKQTLTSSLKDDAGDDEQEDTQPEQGIEGETITNVTNATDASEGRIINSMALL